MSKSNNFHTHAILADVLGLYYHLRACHICLPGHTSKPESGTMCEDNGVVSASSPLSAVANHDIRAWTGRLRGVDGVRR
jgi:hypothetical protein